MLPSVVLTITLNDILTIGCSILILIIGLILLCYISVFHDLEKKCKRSNKKIKKLEKNIITLNEFAITLMKKLGNEDEDVNKNEDINKNEDKVDDKDENEDKDKNKDKGEDNDWVLTLMKTLTNKDYGE